MLDGAYDPEENYKENKYFANSWQSSRARMYPLLTEKVGRCFNGSDFTGRDIIAGKNLSPCTFASRRDSLKPRRPSSGWFWNP